MKPEPFATLDLSQEAVLAELATLRRLLIEADKPSAPNGEDGLVLLRLCPDLDMAHWQEISSTGNLHDWLALPLSANPLPSLARIQTALRELTFLSEHDPLTKLNNRGSFQRILEAEVIRASRSGQSLSLALMDLDNFKSVNDTYGHPCGDQVLQDVSTLLRTEKRAYDTAARVGGEEFALILPGLGLTRAEKAVTRILEAVQALTILCEGVDAPLRMSFSAGLACTKGKAPITADALYAQADKALYEAKNTGKNRLISAPITDLAAPPEESLVRADEKRFLFTGITKG